MAFDTDFVAFERACAVVGNFEGAGMLLGFGEQKTAMMAAARLNRWKVNAGLWTPAFWKRQARACGYLPIDRAYSMRGCN